MARGPLDTRRIETYAHTLFEAALSEDRVFEDLNAIEVLAKAAPEFHAVLHAMQQQDDLDLIEDVASAYAALIAANREAAGSHVEPGGVIGEIPSNEVVGVHVTTAVPLDDELRTIIQNRCEADIRSKVFLIEHVDPTIIGGIILSARGHHRDASVKTQLDLARKVLTQQINETEV